MRARRSSLFAVLGGRSGTAKRSPWPSLTGSFLLALLVAAVPLARGGVDLWTEAAALAIAVGALFLAADGDAKIPGVALALMGVVALLLVQLLPAPAFVHRLSPGAVRIFETSLAPLGLYPAMRPLSVDPATTAREVGKAIAVIAALVAASSVANTRRRRQVVIVGLVLSGVASAVVVLGLALVGAGSLVAPAFPFVNRNHLAAVLNLSALLALALALRGRGPSRALWLLGFTITSVVSILTLSRGGFVALVLGTAMLVLLHIRTSADVDRREASVRAGLTSVALLLALAVAAYLALDPLVAKLGTLKAGAQDTRWNLWRPALQVLGDFPILGVGRGAFSNVFASYQFESATYQFTHVENEWLQAALDLGLPGGLLLVGAFAWTWLTAAARRDLYETEIGLLAGTAAVALQNVVDFSLEVLGVAVPFAVAIGLLARRQRTWSVRPAPFRAALAAFALLASMGLLVGWRHGVAVDQARVDAAAGGTATAAAARAAAAWHPADWYPHAAAGVRLVAELRCGEGMRWLLRAMALYPSVPAPHLAAARCLAGRDDVAARREYRLAILFGIPALPEAAARYPALADLLEIAPSTPDGLLTLGAMLEPTRPSDALAVFRRAVDEYSDDRGLLPLARIYAGAGDHEGAVAFARRYQTASKSDPAGYALAASSLFRLGRDADARLELDRGLAAAPGSVDLIRILVGRAVEAHLWSEARRLTDEIAPRSPRELAEKLFLTADVLAGQGRLREAIEAARSAVAAQPDEVRPLLTVAALCEQSGRYQEALDALRRAASIRPDLPELASHATRIETLLASQRDSERERVIGGSDPLAP